MLDGELNITRTRKLFELLRLIEKRPNLILTKKSITALQNFLNGYMALGCSDPDIYEKGEPSIEEFKDWILRKNKDYSGVEFPFSRVLLKECNSNEEEAFGKFFKYLAEFKQLKSEKSNDS